MSPHHLTRIYDEHAEALFRFLLDFTGNEADTKDVLQEVFVRLARGAEFDEVVRTERGWLIRIARNLAIDLSRRRETRQRNYDAFRAQPTPKSSPGHGPDETTFQVALEGALEELPLEQREVVHLKTWSGLTFEEIADALGISPNTAASRYRYGVDKLRARLRPLYDEIK
jgi:RNA polymerase sigma-70 factor (ECF subfamily)